MIFFSCRLLKCQRSYSLQPIIEYCSPLFVHINTDRIWIAPAMNLMFGNHNEAILLGFASTWRHDTKTRLVVLLRLLWRHVTGLKQYSWFCLYMASCYQIEVVLLDLLCKWSPGTKTKLYCWVCGVCDVMWTRPRFRINFIYDVWKSDCVPIT